MANLNANLSGYDAQEGFDVLPAGWYEAEVVDSEIKEGGKGPYINWTFQVTGKPNKVWDIMSLGNEISMKRLKTLAVCAGHPNPNYIADTDELHGKKCMIRLKIEQDKSGQYEPKNKVSAFKPMNPNSKQPPTITQAAETQPSAQPDTAPAPKKPWE